MKRFLPGFSALFLIALSCSLVAEDTSATKLRKIPDKLVVLTFDDCNKSDRAFVAEEVKKHGFGATFYVTEGLGFLRNKDHYVTWEEIVELHQMGFEIGNHTRTHPHMPRLSKERMKGELVHIEKRCEQYKIPRPVTFCYPGFGHNLACVEVLREMNYLFARRGVGPEFKDGGKGARGPAYDPRVDHPLLVPTTGYAGPDWKFEDLVWAV
jgi:peptidoglycan/xylan/chitin deacetylase (PgdA/CDA1 family)